MDKKIEYGIFAKKDDKYVLIRGGFLNREFATKRALTLEKKFESQNNYQVKLYVLRIKRD